MPKRSQKSFHDPNSMKLRWKYVSALNEFRKRVQFPLAMKLLLVADTMKLRHQHL